MQLSDATTRVVRRLAIGLIAGGGLVLFTATAAHADQTTSPGGFGIVDQRPKVTNSGSAVATTGNNTASGNTSDNTSADSNSSKGHASIETGPAVAKGNVATTNVTQSATTSTTKHGASIIDQSANVTNRGAAIARTGNNGVTADGSSGAPLIPVAASHRALGGTLTPLPTSSGGTTPKVPLSGTHLGSGPSGSTTPLGAAPTGTESPSPLTADATSTPVDALATVPLRSNRVMGAISGAGPPDILTGPATATGNQATTDVAQDASASGSGLGIIDQPVRVVNVGKATANTGHNGNATELTTGTATATGNLATTTVTQSASATGTSVTIVDQPVRVSNIGAAVATTGHNDSDTRLSTGDATALGDRAHVTVSQLAATPVAAKGTVTRIGQNVNAAGLGSALATTGKNSVKSTGDSNDDGHAHIDTGNADALGADVATDIGQASA